MIKIQDQFTNLNVSRQRKYQLRNPEKHKQQKNDYLKTEVGHTKKLEAMRRWRQKNPNYSKQYMREYNKKSIDKA